LLTALALSERSASKRQRRHKKLTDWGRQVVLQAARWLPKRDIVAVAGSSSAAIELPGRAAALHDHPSAAGCPAV